MTFCNKRSALPEAIPIEKFTSNYQFGVLHPRTADAASKTPSFELDHKEALTFFLNLTLERFHKEHH